jgi:Dyp-type peroxidase family
VAAVDIDRADIQGDILEAYGNRYSHTSYLFIGIGDPASGRAWLSDQLPKVTTAVRWSGRRPRSTFNLAVTSSGLSALSVSVATIESFSDEFQQGMNASAADLGDVGDSAPDHWEAGLGTREAHLLVTINALDDAVLQEAVDELRSGLAKYGQLAVVHDVHARMFTGAREHFGFADGFSQPAIEGVSEDARVGEGVPDSGGWRPLALGEFILGNEDEESRTDRQRRLPSAPNDPLGRNSTYMVWRKVRQDVALFRRTVREASRHYSEGEAKLMAKVVGRWPNGAPLATSADAPPAHFDPRAPGTNAFGYANEDPNGFGCPLGAHVRRSNPRDNLGFDGKLAFRHRIIRRGMPYGPPLKEGALEDDGEDRGLVFVCFNASISRQFEGIQRQWLNDGNIFHLGDDPDYLLGGTAGKMTIQGRPPFMLAPQAQFVTARGGEYLFVPSLTALAAIADGVAG